MPPEQVAFADDAALRARLHERVARYTPFWMKDAVDDIVQLAWLRLQKTVERGEGDRTPASQYVARVAYCVTVDEIRRRRRRHEVPVGENEDNLRADAIDPARAVRAREIGDAIEVCLGRLLESRRRAVALYLQGHSVPETGAFLGWNRKRADNMVFRGMEDLRRCLAEKGIAP
jgi:RNA polymerase sigma-70 factor (ECF subfamily)